MDNTPASLQQQQQTVNNTHTNAGTFESSQETAAVENRSSSTPLPVDKEKEMAELLITMDNYTPIIPDAVIEHYLNKTGFDCDDPRIKKLFALAAQKFVADIATDAFQVNKASSTRGTSTNSKSNKEKKAILNTDDLSSALAEYGVNVKKPDYYS